MNKRADASTSARTVIDHFSDRVNITHEPFQQVRRVIALETRINNVPNGRIRHPHCVVGHGVWLR